MWGGHHTGCVSAEQGELTGVTRVSLVSSGCGVKELSAIRCLLPTAARMPFAI